MIVRGRIGFILLGLWLIFTGLVTFVPALAGLGLIMAIVAIIAGILIIAGQ